MCMLYTEFFFFLLTILPMKKSIYVKINKTLSKNLVSFFKWATKLYFVHYSRVVMILLSTGLCESVFFT